MSKNLIRVLFYGMTLVSVLLLLFSFSYMRHVKNAPLVTIEGLRGVYFLNGKQYSGVTNMNLGTYHIVGEAILRLYGNRVKIVRIPQFEVEVIWEK
ncbi:hypothetical protein MNL76_02375 [Fervidobacterium riparium]|uniref:PEGA domain-containing protein n=1 Tax=Fervidobacterium gondwanense DSM 13020 TaxID=1121883 RepID=A0A1M7SRI1_FERGO|nr:hypothetical protein [Fervidobacterium gondwanense]UXF00612.1 hypothetical protein IB67_03290 [Fervidobacterium riparium]SHN61008.1 hypothetical protein SAMN02745226_01165 [Fervidobacterium gondwanense DSM 13020]